MSMLILIVYGSITAIFLLWIRYWAMSLLTLMAMDGDAFRGQQDKLIWGLIFIFVPLLAPFLFASGRERLAEHRRVQSLMDPSAPPQESPNPAAPHP